jgi:hypothetical protein
LFNDTVGGIKQSTLFYWCELSQAQRPKEILRAYIIRVIHAGFWHWLDSILALMRSATRRRGQCAVPSNSKQE